MKTRNRLMTLGMIFLVSLFLLGCARYGTTDGMSEPMEEMTMQSESKGMDDKKMEAPMENMNGQRMDGGMDTMKDETMQDTMKDKKDTM